MLQILFHTSVVFFIDFSSCFSNDLVCFKVLLGSKQRAVLMKSRSSSQLVQRKLIPLILIIDLNEPFIFSACIFNNSIQQVQSSSAAQNGPIKLSLKLSSLSTNTSNMDITTVTLNQTAPHFTTLYSQLQCKMPSSLCSQCQYQHLCFKSR